MCIEMSLFLPTQIAVVVVDEDRDSTIGSIFREPMLFLNIFSNIDALVDIFWLAIRFFKFLENDCCLLAYQRYQLERYVDLGN